MDLASPRFQVLATAEAPVRSPDLTQARLDIETVADPAAFVALRDDWIALFAACGQRHQVFQAHEWLTLWAGLYERPGCRLAVVTGRIEGRLVVAWPLVIQRICGIRVLTGMGAPFAQYTDALMAPDLDPSAVDQMLGHVLALPVDVVALRRVRDDAALAPWLRRRGPVASQKQKSPIVRFDGISSVAAFEARFSGKVRSNRRRRRRRLEERGPVVFVPHAAVPETASLVAMAFAFKREWARRAGVTSPALRDPRFERMFAEACRAGAGAPEMRLSVLHCGDEVAGIEISVAAKGGLCGHVLAPNPAFAELGVGGILAEATIVSALEQGCAEIDLLAPADDYKMEWADTTIGVADYVVARSALGRAYQHLWIGWGRQAAKRLAARLRPLLARRRTDAA